MYAVPPDVQEDQEACHAAVREDLDVGSGAFGGGARGGEG